MRFNEMMDAIVISKADIEKGISHQSLKNLVTTNPEFKNFSDLLLALDKILGELLESKTIELSYIDTYTNPPKLCCFGKNSTLLFARLHEKEDEKGKRKARDNQWIARIPLIPNSYQKVQIYFPTDITFASNMAERPSQRGKHTYHVPNSMQNFLQNPEHFLSIDRIKQRIRMP
jgi:hypothetical protein